MRASTALIVWLVLNAVPLTPAAAEPPWNQYRIDAVQSTPNPTALAASQVIPAVIAAL